MTSINEIVREYLQATEAEAAAKKRAAALKAEIMERAAGRPSFETDDYTVIIKEQPRQNLDTAALYRDFPDIKDVYRRDTVTRSVVAVLKEQQQKTA